MGRKSNVGRAIGSTTSLTRQRRSTRSIFTVRHSFAKKKVTDSASSDAPTFTKKPKDVSTDPGKKVSLECEADGNPAPTYAWFRNGDENNVREYF